MGLQLLKIQLLLCLVLKGLSELSQPYQREEYIFNFRIFFVTFTGIMLLFLLCVFVYNFQRKSSNVSAFMWSFSINSLLDILLIKRINCLKLYNEFQYSATPLTTRGRLFEILEVVC